MNPSLFVLLAQLAGAPSAAASFEDQDLLLQWEAPRSCPQIGEVRARLKQLLGSSEPPRPRRPLEVHAIVRELSASVFSLELEASQGQESFSRTLTASTCDGIADAGALLIALAIDPELATQGGGRGPLVSSDADPERRTDAAGAGAPRAAAPRTAIPFPTPRPAPVRASNLRFGALVSGVADAGTLPALAYGPALGLFASLGMLRIELGGVGLLPRTGTVPGHPTEGGQVDLLAAELRSCAGLGRLGLDLHACGAIEVGRSRVEGFGADANGVANSLWLAPGLSLIGVLPLTRTFSWRAQVSALFPLQRPEFIIENTGSAHRAGVLALRAGFGIEANFQ